MAQLKDYSKNVPVENPSTSKHSLRSQSGSHERGIKRSVSEYRSRSGDVRQRERSGDGKRRNKSGDGLGKAKSGDAHKHRSKSVDHRQRGNGGCDKHRNKSGGDERQRETGGGVKHERKSRRRRRRCKTKRRPKSANKKIGCPHENRHRCKLGEQRKRPNCRKSKRRDKERTDKPNEIKDKSPDFKAGKTFTGRVKEFTEFQCIVQLRDNDTFQQRLVLSHVLRPDQIQSSGNDLLIKGDEVQLKITSVVDDRVMFSVKKLHKESPMDRKNKDDVPQPTQTYDMLWIKKETAAEENVEDSSDESSGLDSSISIYSDDITDNDDDTVDKEPALQTNARQPQKAISFVLGKRLRKMGDLCVQVNGATSGDGLTKNDIKKAFADVRVSRANIKILQREPCVAFVKFDNSYDKHMAMTFNGKTLDGGQTLVVGHLDDDDYDKETADDHSDRDPDENKTFVWPEPAHLAKNMLKLVGIPATVTRREILKAANESALLAADAFAEDQSGLKAILVFSTTKAAEITLKWHRCLFLGSTPVPLLRCTDQDVCQWANRIKAQPSLVKSLVLKRKTPTYLSPLRIKLLLREFSDKFNKIKPT